MIMGDMPCSLLSRSMSGNETNGIETNGVGVDLLHLLFPHSELPQGNSDPASNCNKVMRQVVSVAGIDVGWVSASVTRNGGRQRSRLITGPRSEDTSCACRFGGLRATALTHPTLTALHACYASFNLFVPAVPA